MYPEANLLVASATCERLVFELVFADVALHRCVFGMGRNKLGPAVCRWLGDAAGVSRIAAFFGHAVVGDNA